MKRDIELLRKILLEIEDKYQPGETYLQDLDIQGYDMLIVAEHSELLSQAGLINEYRPFGTLNGFSGFWVGNLTNYGYDYLENIRQDKVWEDTKNEIEKKKLPKTIETIGIIASSIFGAFMREYNRG